MSRTRRIYNNPRVKKCRRFNLDDGEIHVWSGIPLTWRSWICMGNCPIHKDHSKDTKIIRKKNKEMLRLTLQQEMIKYAKTG